MSGSLLALVVVLVGLAFTLFWFGVNRRRDAEVAIGIQSLARMKWRDCIAVVLEALRRDGYGQNADSGAGIAGGTEFLLVHEGDKVLFCYKHGTAYHLGDANVHEFANALQMRGASRGILLTLGSVDAAAHAAAKSCNVQLLDGGLLWHKVRPFMPADTVELVHRQAASWTRKGVWTGVAASALAGVATYLIANSLSSPADQVATSPAPIGIRAKSVGSDDQAPRSDEAMLKQINATARLMADVAKLPASELAERRARAAKDVALIPEVDTAAWSAQSTLLVTLNKTDGKDKGLIDEMCRILTQYEELRFTRIQMEPPAGSNLAVRWRLCD